jgi:uncharacterized protein (DUF58 family)
MKFRQWRQRPTTDNSPSIAQADRLNSATHVTTSELIALQQAARKLKLERSIPATASTVGSHRSRFRGRGMDYSESRVYQAGDDIRGMDWRVTARAGKPHTKLYEEERERPVVMLLDFSPSLFFGSRKALKSVVLARAATLLGWAAARNGDRIGALLFNGEHTELPPKSGQHGALNLIRQLVRYSDPLHGLAAEPKRGHLNAALKRLRRTVRPGSLVFLLSDFYDIDDDTGTQLQRLQQHNDIVAIQVVDPLELEAPPPGRYAVTDGRQTGFLDTTSRRTREQYNAFFAAHHQRIEELMRRYQIPLLQLSTADDVTQTLQSWFGASRRKSLQQKHRAA